jgi:hypothetical protein
MRLMMSHAVADHRCEQLTMGLFWCPLQLHVTLPRPHLPMPGNVALFMDQALINVSESGKRQLTSMHNKGLSTGRM